MEFPTDRVEKYMIKSDTTVFNNFLTEWYDDKPYVIAHTSGSTGTPKKIELLKSDMIHSASATCTFFGINDTSRLFLPLSVDYIAGKMMIIRAIMSNATLDIVTPSTDPFSAIATGSSYTLAAIVPSQLNSLIKNMQRINIENIIIGGSPLSNEQLNMIISSGLNAWATYGMTETCSHVALKKLSVKNSFFEALPDITFDTDPRGCLMIKCAKMSWKRLITNDVVELKSPTAFEWIGRYDNIINSGGIKINPEQDEAILKKIWPDKTFFIVGRKSEQWGEESVLVIEGEPWTSKQLILQQAKDSLPQYHAPKAIIFTPTITRTSSGKIKRQLP
jgi:O-succinylbenzoic acid--coA ligase